MQPSGLVPVLAVVFCACGAGCVHHGACRDKEAVVLRQLRQGRYRQAARSAREALAYARRHLDREDLDLLRTRLNRARTLFVCARYRVACEAFQGVLDAVLDALGPAGRRPLDVLANCGHDLADDACRLACKTIGLRVDPRDRLAADSRDRGDLDASIDLYGRLFELYKDEHGEKSMKAGLALVELGDVFKLKKAYADANRLYTRALEILGPRMKPDHELIGRLHYLCAVCQFELGERTAARRHMRRARRILKNRAGTRAPSSPTPAPE